MLVLNGTYDTQTGLSGARHVAAHFPNAYYVELPAIGYGVLFGGEVVYQVARDFLVNPLQAPDSNAVSNLSLDFPPPWPTDAPHLGAEESIAITFEAGGQAAWHRFTAQSGIVYDIELDGATLCIVDDQARILFSSENSAHWTAGHDAEVHLMLVSDTAGSYPLRIVRPLLIRAIEMDHGQAVLTWQGPTGTANTIEVSTDLAGPAPFMPLAQELPALQTLRSHSVPVDPNAKRLFFRITEP